ncbi:cytochrome P450 [Actinoplanes sp. CA-142083]|uniref:cytochrome P450 n=1 Tax=Actinoplanes sp. CA-142083 TaxID=3239903 RepID=UPI003D89EF6E
MAEPRIPAGFDFTDPEICVHGIPHAEFAELRRHAPVWWIPQERGSAGFDDDGYWAVTRHADVMAVSRDSETFSSWENTAIVRFQSDMPRDRIEMQRYVMLNMDPPQHTQQRAIVSRGFTPRAINSLRAALQTRAERIVGEASEAGDGSGGDFVTEIACELPLQAIAELLGVPQEDRRNVFDWSNAMIGYDDPEYRNVGDPLEPAMELLGYAMKMAEDRQACPRDDIVSTLVQAEIGGEHLSSDEFGFFVLMLAVAGNETTRNAISHGMLALLEHPEQWEAFKASRPRTAVDEIVRWGTPVNVFQRTATRDVELGGQQIAKGQRVALFYGSANFDEEVFDHPENFDITRSPNPHLGFGGSGAHFCLGANLARLEIDLIFNAIADHMPGISLAGPAERLRSGWLNSIKHLPVRYR